MRRIGPGMIQQMQAVCGDCNGEGVAVADGDRCETCSGNKVVKNRQVLEVFIEKGMKHGQKIYFRGEGDQAPNTDPGDVIFVVKQKDHPIFTRRGGDLLMEKHISLLEALSGAQFVLEHLDGRNIVVRSQPGAIIKPGDVLSVAGEGMPVYKDPFQKGNLFVKFVVDFPESGSLSDQQRQVLESVLPPRPPLPAAAAASGGTNDDMDVNSGVEEVLLQDMDLATFGQSGAGGGGEAYDSDEERGGPQQVGCQQQ